MPRLYFQSAGVALKCGAGFFVGGARPSHSLVVPFYMFYTHANSGGQRSVVAMRRLQIPLASVADALGIGGNDGALPSTDQV